MMVKYSVSYVELSKKGLTFAPRTLEYIQSC
jgi:hypothetical protein